VCLAPRSVPCRRRQSRRQESPRFGMSVTRRSTQSHTSINVPGFCNVRGRAGHIHGVRHVIQVDDLTRFEQLFADHMDAVLAYALARADPESAKDAAADTFLVAWRRIHEVPDPARAWLLGVTRRTLAGQHRSRYRQRQLVERIVAFRDRSVDQPGTVPDMAERPIVARALAELRARDRELLCLIAWDGLSNAEAAEVLKCSPNTFGVRLHRARRRFEAAPADERTQVARAEPDGSSFTGVSSAIDSEVHHGDA